MTEAPVLDVEVVEPDSETKGAEMVAVPAPPVPAVAVAPAVEAAELVKRLAVIREAMETAMVRDIDYGVIPGTDKPTLYKPGSEKLSVLFQLDVQLVNEKTFGPGEHLTVQSRATVYHIPTGARMGFGEGLCTTREKKYGKRQANLVCPHCGTPAVIKGKAEYGGGWLCWAKRDGCGAKFDDGDQAIEGQERGEVENPDMPDLWNTVLKMAEKRARIDAVLAVTGASALFTQDLEDQVQPVAHANGQQPVPRERTGAPRTTAQPAQRSERPATANQKGAINGRFSKAVLSLDEATAILQWLGGVPMVDRLASKQASQIIDALGRDGEGAQQILEDIRLAATDGDERAQQVVSRYLSGGTDA